MSFFKNRFLGLKCSRAAFLQYRYSNVFAFSKSEIGYNTGKEKPILKSKAKV